MAEAISQPMAEEFREFWEGAKREEIRFPKCADCGKFHWYPQKLCPYCQSEIIRWTKIKGNGQLYSWTVVRHPFDPAFADKLPYIVALIVFDDAPGVRFISNMFDLNPEEMKIGMPVEPIFQKVSQDSTLVYFKPSGT